MKHRREKQPPSCLTSIFGLAFVIFWALVCIYPAFWHVMTDDPCYRRYGIWRVSSFTVGAVSVAFYDLYHRYLYPVHNAVIRSRADLLRQMTKSQLKSDQKDGFDMTALAYAARYGLKSELEILLANGASPDLITWNDMTATMHALDKGHYKIALYLVENGADASIANLNGKSAIHLAAQMNQDQIIAKVAENPANLTKLDVPDIKGLTPLDYAINKNSFRAIMQLAASGAECQFSTTPKTDEISVFLSNWQKSGEKPFTMSVSAESEGGYYSTVISDKIPAELPENVKPETFRNRGH
ncbi:MAG: ankyrin repeat domain-containing protein [Candidatus Riflebacteria bacterium]|nr:ankyrin repeat domain-containing protein [Candidatus Riflebacteria bacterium]